MTIQVFEVGGCVRDELLGIPSNDVDLLLVGAESFDHGVEHAKSLGVQPIPGTFRPEFATFKAAVPKDHKLRERCKSVDFVLSRKDGLHGDGRRPDSTEPGTLEDDLQRRDFTINAMAKDLATGEIVDLFDGRTHLKERLLHFVGDPFQRVREDGLRVLRAIRFSVTKGLNISEATAMVLQFPLASEKLDCVSRERVREELEKMFRHDTLRALETLSAFPNLLPALFKDGLRLSATLKDA